MTASSLGLTDRRAGTAFVYGTRDSFDEWRITESISSTYGVEMQFDNIDGQFYAGLLGRTIQEFASHMRIRNEQGQEVDLSTLAGASYLNISDTRISVTLVGNSYINFASDNMVYIRHDSGLISENVVKIS